MALTKLSTSMDNVQGLADLVQDQATAVKQTFDKAGNDIKTYVNDTLTAEQDTINTDLNDRLTTAEGEIDALQTADGQNVKLTGNQTVAGIKTFSSSPIVPAPTTDTQASTKKYVDDENAKDVHLTGDQTIAGVKTFSSSPIVPTPTTSGQASTKGYVDTSIAGVVLGQIPDNSLTEDKMAAGMKKQSGGVAAYDTVDTHIADKTAHDIDIIRLAKTCTGAVNTLAVDTEGTFDLTKEGNKLTIIPNLTNTSSATIAADGQTAKAIKKFDTGTDAFINLVAGDYKKNTPTELVWSLANDFFILRPSGAGSNIKSIQEVGVSLANTNTTIDTSISSVDPNKCDIKISFRAGGVPTAAICSVMADITSITNLRLVRNTGTSIAITVYVTIIEYINVKSFQQGTLAPPATTEQTVTVSTYDPLKSILSVTTKSSNTTNNVYYFSAGARKINSTSIGLQADTANTIAYRLLEFN